MTAMKKAVVSLNKEDIREAIADYIEQKLGGKDRAVRPSKLSLNLSINTAQNIPLSILTKIDFEQTNLFVDVEVTLI